jgi:hypothetical protein
MKAAPFRVSRQSAVSGATSFSVMKRRRAGGGAGRSAFRPPTRVVGIDGDTGVVFPTRICITAASGGAGVETGEAG